MAANVYKNKVINIYIIVLSSKLFAGTNISQCIRKLESTERNTQQLAQRKYDNTTRT